MRWTTVHPKRIYLCMHESKIKKNSKNTAYFISNQSTTAATMVKLFFSFIYNNLATKCVFIEMQIIFPAPSLPLDFEPCIAQSPHGWLVLHAFVAVISGQPRL
ncbi:hypothetical protein Pst134EA_013673 [Puccinia striiformis f. sp. tritici]|uniref:hypothetical protein n=1 Tax=Puccinia striiformis f. sp. tritici TaxID=168172 RepID=UPI002007CA3F|nr:hypothetical protein Pst134EA_013673 [Puccinia striiformis f. sp. tritici]KAH9465809.1 hypothetical protein Pst134EA_013673 [Puccinia striiformis f. sp. tritici]